MSKMKFLDPKEAEKFKNKSGQCFVGHPVPKNIFEYFSLFLNNWQYWAIFNDIRKYTTICNKHVTLRCHGGHIFFFGRRASWESLCCKVHFPLDNRPLAPSHHAGWIRPHLASRTIRLWHLMLLFLSLSADWSWQADPSCARRLFWRQLWDGKTAKRQVLSHQVWMRCWGGRS